MPHHRYNLEPCHTQISPGLCVSAIFSTPQPNLLPGYRESTLQYGETSGSSSTLAVAETRLPPLQARLSARAAGKIYLLFSTLKSPWDEDLCTAPSPTKSTTLRKPGSNLSNAAAEASEEH